jgi:malonate-semialdehyde dehydrogenase (acetylating) / methylmalonate-semialdehyde dehydrogenase
MSSAFGAAGERCLAGSVLVPVGEAAEPLLAADSNVATQSKWATARRLHRHGAVVTKGDREKIVGYIEKGVAEGARPAVRRPPVE